MPRAGRRSPSPRSPRASKARPPSTGSRKRRVTKPASAEAATVAVTPRQALWLELMPFYIHEAWLLDERKFKEWLDLFTDDVLYFMPPRKNMLRRVNGAWKIAKRTVLLDANVLLDKNLSIFL